MKELGVKDNDSTKKEFPLVGFNNSTIYVIGTVVFPIMVTSSVMMTNFVVIDVLAHYNTILERLWIHKMGVIPSILHQVVKYPIEKGKEEINGD